MRVQVAIEWGRAGWPAAGELLQRAGVEAIVLEQRSADYVLGRIRAGVLEQASVDLLHEAGVGERLQREGRCTMASSCVLAANAIGSPCAS